MAVTGKNTLFDIWNSKIRDIDFIHEFFMDELVIYHNILAQRPQKLAGRLNELAKSHGVSNEAFFGFLLGIEPLVNYDLQTLLHRDRVNIKINYEELYEHLKQKPSYVHLLELEGWGIGAGRSGEKGEMGERTEVSDIEENIPVNNIAVRSKANIFYGIPSERNVIRNIDKWSAIAGEPDVFVEKDENLDKFKGKLLDKYEVVSLKESMERFPNADVWVTYRKADNTANMLLTKLPPERIHFLEADLVYRKGCEFLGHFISYRKDSFSPCCITGQAPIIATTGTLGERLKKWEDYTTKLVDNVTNNEPNDCQRCHLLKDGFYQKNVKLQEVNFGSNNPGDICNFNCIYCFCEKKLSHLENADSGFATYEIIRQISKIPEYNRSDFIIQLANGEFCANRHCNDMLDIFLATEWTFRLLSNFSIYREKLAVLMETGRIRSVKVSLDAGTKETFQKVKRVNSFERVLENIKKYPTDKTVFSLKYIFLEGINDNQTDVDAFYEIARENNARIIPSSNLNIPLTDKMKDLTQHLIQRAKADGVIINSENVYLAPKDAKFIRESYASALDRKG